MINIGINHSLDNILFFGRHTEQETMEKFTEKNEFFTTFVVYLFVVDGNEPCNHINKILFGKDEEFLSCLWTITLKEFLHNMPTYLKEILNKKIDEFKNTDEPRVSLGRLYNFIMENNISMEKSIDTLVDMAKNHIHIHLTAINRDNDSNFMEYFEVRQYPSFAICSNAKIHSINYKNNPFGLAENIDNAKSFVEWFNTHMKLMLDIFCETILISWIVKNSHNY